MKSDKKIVVSACMAGINCKYDGGNNTNVKILKLLEEDKIILVCPEELGGMTTPRIPSEIVDGKVLAKTGVDVTNSTIYLYDADDTSTALNTAEIFDHSLAYLPDTSEHALHQQRQPPDIELYYARIPAYEGS